MALAIEFHNRYHHIHACTKHILWLYENIPVKFELVESPKAYYSSLGYPTNLTKIPECMPEKYHTENIVDAYTSFYKGEKLSFARWKIQAGP